MMPRKTQITVILIVVTAPFMKSGQYSRMTSERNPNMENLREKGGEWGSLPGAKSGPSKYRKGAAPVRSGRRPLGSAFRRRG